jgi:ABC-type iron transport system FetAB ATPase subunit
VLLRKVYDEALMLESPRSPGANYQFVAKHLCRTIEGRLLYSDISFTLDPGEILFIRGPSGTGKTLLLRSLAALDPLSPPGFISLGHNQTPERIGIPKWRSLVTYVFQQRISFPGTPSQLYYTAQSFANQRGKWRGDLPATIHQLGLEQSVLGQPWSSLSGGQAQRVYLAIAIALSPAVLLLDEPSASLDQEATRRVEKVLKTCGAALVWVSHDPEQPTRVGGRVLDLATGRVSIATSPPSSPLALTPSSLPSTTPGLTAPPNTNTDSKGSELEGCSLVESQPSAS